jgi:glycine/D-amino acid oxidase-like deaminating enzyme
MSARAGLDGYTPDEHAIIGRIAGLNGLYLAVGFSGGGVKIAPAVGRAVAAELTANEGAPELEGFRYERFETGRLIEAEFPYAYM